MERKCLNCGETQVNPFVDVPVNSYYLDSVLWALENGITTGTSSVTFSPSESCGRAQVVTFLWRAEGSPVVEGACVFTDVEDGSFYDEAVLWASQNGIASGLTATTFGPNAVCNRAQIVTFLYRAYA